MKKRFLELPVHHKIFFATVAFAVLSAGTFAGIFYAKKAFTSPAPSFPAGFRMPSDPSRMSGETAGIGTHFAITNSEYLNIALDSTETVDLKLTSIPKVITMMFAEATTSATTQITLFGLLKNTTYYKYEDDYHHLAEFTSDENGTYTYAQDISVRHLVFIQTRKSTKFISDTGGDCTAIGNWNTETKTCTLTQDLAETVQIDGNGITLDGNGHTLTITPQSSTNGVYIYDKASIMVKNLTVSGASRGIFLYQTNSSSIAHNALTGNYGGIEVSYSDNNTIERNTANDNIVGIRSFYSFNNKILDNTMQENGSRDFDFLDECNNTITGNIGSGGRPIGFFNSPTNLNGGTFSELILCNADNSNISNVTVRGSADKRNNGLFVILTDHSNFTDITSDDDYAVMIATESNGNTFKNITIGSNARRHVVFRNSDSNIIKNLSMHNDYALISLANANDNEFDGSVLNGAEQTGISFSESASNNRIHNSTFSGEPVIFINIRDALSSNNLIYNNNFIGNSQVTDVDGNSFNLPKPIGGNYWSDYDISAEGCNDTNSDGFCDAPYVIPDMFGGESESQDNFPWTRQDGWKGSVDIGQAASDLAKQLVNSQYLWGGKGWDFQNGIFVDPGVIKSGYTYWNSELNSTSTGIGVDCSGLVMWSYDHGVDPTKPHLNNFIKYESADGQYRNNSTSTTEDQLRPGDLMFFNWNGDSRMDHVAEYVGENENYNVVQARNKLLGIATSTVNALKISGFVGFKRPTDARIAMAVKGHSPIDLTVTDPDGNTINHNTVIPSDEEYIREIPGELYYSEMEKGADGLPEDVVYSPVLKQGAYRISVSPMTGSAPNQTYSLDFTAGNTTLNLAQNVPISQIPHGGYGVAVGADNTPILDMIPPEARVGFSTTTKKIVITGTDNLSTPTISTTATSSTITDKAGNTLALAISQNMSRPNHAALIIPSFSYSTGTTTKAATSLRYFWNTDKKGKYIFFISAVRTPTDRQIMIYSQLTNKTYVVAGTASDDNTDLSLQSSRLLLRKKNKTYDGLVIPSVFTNQGKMMIGF